MLRFLTAGESHGPALVVIVEGLPAGLADHRRRRRRSSWPAAASATAAGRGCASSRRGRAPRRRPARPHARFAGGDRDRATPSGPKWHEEMSPAPGRDRASRSPSPGPVTPTSPGCRSTASPTPATCSSGRRPARPRRGSRPARWPRRCSRTSASQVLSHVVQLGAARSKAVTCARRRPTSHAVDESQVRCFDPDAEEAMIAEIEGRGQGRRLARRRRRGARLRRAASASAATCTGTASSTACWPRR